MAVLPLPERVPAAALPPATPSTAQVMAVLVDPESVAVKVVEAPVVRFAEAGLRLRVTGAGAGAALEATTVKVVDPLTLAPAALVATHLTTWLPLEAGAV